jgi:hypothetical protein
MPPTGKDVQAGLSRQLANFKLSDAVVKSLADRITVDGLSIGRFYPCMYGICVDYFSDRIPKLDVFTSKHRVAKWEVFPYGIIDWDRFRVRVAYNVDELVGKVGASGF